MAVSNDTYHFRKAMEYYGLGWQVIPIPPGRKSPPKGFDLLRWREEKITENQVREWWGSRGIAVILGDISGGLMCRDFDAPGWYEKWRKNNPGLAKRLPTTKTAAGHHVYFHWDTKAARDRVGDRESVDIDPDYGEGELRIDRAYCMLPPSKTEDLKSSYRWEVPPGENIPRVDPFEVGLVEYNGLVMKWDTETHDTQETQKHIKMFFPPTAPAAAGEALLQPVSVVIDPEDPQYRDTIMHAIDVSSPSYSTGRRRGKAVFNMVRWLSTNEDLRGMDAKAFKEVVKLWHNTYQHLLMGDNRDFDVTLDKFYAGWGKVKKLPGKQILDAAFQESLRQPIPGEMLQVLLTEDKVRLALLCREMQKMTAPKDFFLGIKDVVRLFGMSGKGQASRMLNTLQAEGVIKKTKQGSRVTGDASEFRYLWPVS